MLHEIDMTELAGRLNVSKQRLECGKQKTPIEEIEESFTKHFALVMGAHEFARRQMAANAETYKNDEEMLERANAAVQDWLRQRT